MSLEYYFFFYGSLDHLLGLVERTQSWLTLLYSCMSSGGLEQLDFALNSTSRYTIITCPMA